MCWCKSTPAPALSLCPHPGCTHSSANVSPSSGRGGAPARCRWSARCPGSTPRGPPCGEHSKATVLAIAWTSWPCCLLPTRLASSTWNSHHCSSSSAMDHVLPPALTLSSPQCFWGPEHAPRHLSSLGTQQLNLSLGLDVSIHVMTLLPEGSPEMFLVPPQLPDTTWQC